MPNEKRVLNCFGLKGEGDSRTSRENKATKAEPEINKCGRKYSKLNPEQGKHSAKHAGDSKPEINGKKGGLELWKAIKQLSAAKSAGEQPSDIVCAEQSS